MINVIARLLFLVLTMHYVLLFHLLQTINDTAPEVREASFDALGTAMKVVSEKVMCALLGDIDALKMAKVSLSLVSLPLAH